MRVLENADYLASGIHCISLLHSYLAPKGLVMRPGKHNSANLPGQSFRLIRLANLRILTVLVSAIIGDLPSSV